MGQEVHLGDQDQVRGFEVALLGGHVVGNQTEESPVVHLGRHGEQARRGSGVALDEHQALVGAKEVERDVTVVAGRLYDGSSHGQGLGLADRLEHDATGVLDLPWVHVGPMRHHRPRRAMLQVQTSTPCTKGCTSQGWASVGSQSSNDRAPARGPALVSN